MKIIENIEKKEKGIIKKINSENKKCVINMMKTSSNFFNFNLPKVRFHKVIKKKTFTFF